MPNAHITQNEPGSSELSCPAWQLLKSWTLAQWKGTKTNQTIITSITQQPAVITLEPPLAAWQLRLLCLVKPPAYSWKLTCVIIRLVRAHFVCNSLKTQPAGKPEMSKPARQQHKQRCLVSPSHCAFLEIDARKLLILHTKQ